MVRVLRVFTALLVAAMAAVVPLFPASAQTTPGELCDEAAQAVTAVTTLDVETQDPKQVTAAADLLRDIAGSEDEKSLCGEQLRALKATKQLQQASAKALQFNRARPKEYAAATAASDALVFDPTNPDALALDAKVSGASCDHLNNLLGAEKWLDAEALIGQLIDSGDDATVKCAEVAKATLANRLSEKRSIVSRLDGYTTGKILGQTVAVAVVVFVALLLWRVFRAVAPARPTMMRIQMWAGPLAVRAGVLLAAASLGALVEAYLQHGVGLAFSLPVWAYALAIAVSVAGIIWACAGFAAGRQGLGDSSGILLLPCAAGGGLFTAHNWHLVAQNLYLWLGAGSAVCVAAWADSAIRVSIGTIEAKPDGAADLGSAIGNEYVSITRAPGGILVSANAPTAAPQVDIAKFPGSAWLTGLLQIWRAVTPSNDLTLTGSFLDEGDKGQRLTLSLRRGRRPYQSVGISSRLFWVDPSKPTEAELARIWSDLATGAAAWLLVQMITMTDGWRSVDLDGARRWEGVALTRVAAARLRQNAGPSARSLAVRAASYDAGNLAAQYSLLALNSLDVDAADQSAAAGSYQDMVDELDALLAMGGF